MKTLEQFISSACEGGGVQNDEKDVWVEVDGAQFTVPIDDVLNQENDAEELEAFKSYHYRFQDPLLDREERAKLSDDFDHSGIDPFMPSFYLENHLDSPVWDNLYEQYCSEQDEQGTEE